MTTAWFVLGQSPHTSLAELGAVYADTLAPHFFVSSAVASVPLPSAPTSLTHLGGVVKVGVQIFSHVPLAELAPRLSEYLGRAEPGKILFGFSYYGTDDTAGLRLIEDLGIDIKNILGEEQRSSRFVDSRGKTVLSSASVVYNKLLRDRGFEFLLIETEPGFFTIAKTTAVQPFEEFGERDFGRPGRDDKSGMLPPKLALMMLNMAGAQKADCLLDPFCGSGTILTEALLQGYQNVVGSDISERAIADTQNNIEWTIKQSEIDTEKVATKIFVSSVLSLTDHLPTQSVHAIVAEPYMGPALRGHEHLEEIKKTSAGLVALYIGAFECFAKILKPGATVVFIIPRFFSAGNWITISDKIMARLKELGFTKERLVSESVSPTTYVLYHRPGQRVGREIWKFTFSK